jgi:hypothetical protein
MRKLSRLRAGWAAVANVCQLFVFADFLTLLFGFVRAFEAQQ